MCQENFFKILENDRIREIIVKEAPGKSS